MKIKQPIILLISASDFENDSRLQRIYERLLGARLDVNVVAYGSNKHDHKIRLSSIPKRSLKARLIDVAKMLGSRILADEQLLKMLSKRLITKDLTANASKAIDHTQISLIVVKHWTSLPTALLLNTKAKIWLDINEVFEAEHDNSKLWSLIYKPVIIRLLKIADQRIILRSATSLDQIKFMDDNAVLHLPNTKEPVPNFEISKQNDQPIRLLYHGLITTNRALETMIHALKKSGRKDLHLTIRGHGKPKYIEALKSKTSELGLEHQLSFKPSVANSELIKLASQYDVGICLFANKSQQLMLCEPNKLYEYMAAGLGILASDTRTMRRLILDKKIGELSPIGESQEAFLIQNLSNLSHEKIQKWRETSYKEALSTWEYNYDWPKLDIFLSQIKEL